MSQSDSQSIQAVCQTCQVSRRLSDTHSRHVRQNYYDFLPSAFFFFFDKFIREIIQITIRTNVIQVINYKILRIIKPKSRSFELRLTYRQGTKFAVAILDKKHNKQNITP